MNTNTGQNKITENEPVIKSTKGIVFSISSRDSVLLSQYPDSLGSAPLTLRRLKFFSMSAEVRRILPTSRQRRNEK